MSYMNCRRCGLGVQLRASFLTLEHCPRCLVRAGMAVPMELSDGPPPPRVAGAKARFVRPDRGITRYPRPVSALVSEHHGSTQRITPTGELDLATSRALEEELLRVERTGAQLIEVDLAGVTFIDSAGVHVLERAHARARVYGSELRLVGCPPAVRRVFGIVERDRRLSFPWTSPGPVGDLPAAPAPAPDELRFVNEWSA